MSTELKITITNLRSVRFLEFNMPAPGTYILTGENGIGKSTLFACLEGIKRNIAFSQHFTEGLPAEFRKNLRRAQVLYEDRGNELKIKLATKRWGASGANAHFRGDAIYAGLHTIHATEKRLFRQSERPNMQSMEPATGALIETMVELTQNSKFRSLRMHRAGDQRGTQWYLQREKVAFALQVDDEGGPTVFTDQSFSLGETMLLNLLYYFEGIQNRSLVLIDEIELALHPKVQVRLLRFLERKAQEKALTVLISSHSASLIKSARNLIFLSDPNRDGRIVVNYKCFPSIALSEIAVREDFLPDFLFLVEDDMAKMLLEQMLEKYWHIKGTEISIRPQVRILPVGGFAQVLFLLDAMNEYIFPQSVIRAAYLDFDAKASLEEVRRKGVIEDTNRELIRILDDPNRFKHYLPITPEVGLVEAMRDNESAMRRLIRSRIPEYNLDYPSENAAFLATHIKPFDKPRKEAKKRIDFLVRRIIQSCNRSESEILKGLFESWVEWYVQDRARKGKLMEILAPVLNFRRL